MADDQPKLKKFVPLHLRRRSSGETSAQLNAQPSAQQPRSFYQPKFGGGAAVDRMQAAAVARQAAAKPAVIRDLSQLHDVVDRYKRIPLTASPSSDNKSLVDYKKELSRTVAHKDHEVNKLQELLYHARAKHDNEAAFCTYIDTPLQLRAPTEDRQVVGLPLLALACARARGDTVRLLLIAGAAMESKATLGGVPVPLLAVAILSRSEEVVQVLCAFGANPFSIPAALWADERSVASATHLQKDVDGWWSDPAMRDQLAAALTYPMRYWLREAARLPPLTDLQRAMFRANSLRALPAVRLAVVGQEAAQVMLLGAVQTWAGTSAHQQKLPLVLVFAGPPGHGKTLVAKQLAFLVSAPSRIISCSDVNDVQTLFGTHMAYRGAEHGADMINFLAANQGRRCVVVLDEFEKLGAWHSAQDMFNGFLRIFDEGIAIDHTQGAGTEINCKDAIFVLTTNILDESILDYCKKHPDVLTTRELGPLKLARKIKDLEGVMKEKLKKAFGASVVVASELRKLQASVKRPPQDEGQIGGLDMVIQDEETLSTLTAQSLYDPHLGARAMDRQLRNLILREAQQRWFQGQIRKGSAFTIKPGPNAEDPLVIEVDGDESCGDESSVDGDASVVHEEEEGE